MIKKAIILACMSVLLFFGMGIRVNAERLFILENLITNGDFSIDSNGDGIANNWTGSGGGVRSYSIDENGQNAFQSGTGSIVIIQYINFVEGHKYYITYSASKTNIASFRMVLSTGTGLYYYGPENDMDGKFIYQANRNYNQAWFGSINNVTNGSFYIDNIMVFDLTQLFGFGYEPSLSDFELYYLPNLDYFDTFNSFEPELFTQLNESDYLDLGEDLTGIDYTKSIIDVNGENIDLDLNAYFYDTWNGSTLISGIYTALDYVNDNHPIMYYNGETYTLNWAISDYSQRVIYLDLSEEEEEILKRILFNRTINRTQEFFYIKVETGFLGDAKFWFSLGSKFDLLVDAKSFLISRKTVTLNDYNVMNEMYIKTYDQNGNVILPALMFNIGQTVKTSYVDDFGSLYTNISRFNFEFELNSPSIESTYDYELLFFYELGIFSSDKVIQPPKIDSEIPYLWDMKVCDFYQIGCHLGNFANETVSTIYSNLKIDEITDFFDGISESASKILSIVPDNIGAIIAVILGGVGVALIVVIIERANK